MGNEGFRVWDLGFRAWGLVPRAYGLGFRVCVWSFGRAFPGLVVFKAFGCLWPYTISIYPESEGLGLGLPSIMDLTFLVESQDLPKFGVPFWGSLFKGLSYFGVGPLLRETILHPEKERTKPERKQGKLEIVIRPFCWL